MNITSDGRQCLQNKQKLLRMPVTVSKLARLIESPIAPKIRPANMRAKYGKLAKIPACAKLKPSTSFMNFGAAVIKKFKPHMLP